MRRVREKSHIRLHHANDCGGNLPAANAHGLADDLGISAKLALPELIAEHDCFCGSLLEVDIGEAASCRGTETYHVHVVPGDHHSLHRVAAVIVDQEIESPIVAGDSLKGFCFVAPIHPLFGWPARGRSISFPSVRAVGTSMSWPGPGREAA